MFNSESLRFVHILMFQSSRQWCKC